MDISVAFVINQVKNVAPVQVMCKIISDIKKEYSCKLLVISLNKQKKEDIPNYYPSDIELISLGYNNITSIARYNKISKEITTIMESREIKIAHSHSFNADIVCSFLPNRFIKITTQHNIASQDFVLSKGQFIGTLMYHLLKRRIVYFDKIVGVSKTVANMCRGFTTDKDEKYIAIYNDISIDKKILNRDQKTQTDYKRIIFCGNLSNGKDPLLLIEAFVELLSEGKISNNTKLDILGEGPLQKECKKIAQLYPDNIFIYGYVSDAIRHMSKADIFVSCSKSEGLGISLIEAIAVGLIPVCTKIPAFDEILSVDKKDSEMRFDVGNKASLKNILVKALSYTPSNSLREHIIKTFISGNMSKEYYKLYITETQKINGSNKHNSKIL